MEEITHVVMLEHTTKYEIRDTRSGGQRRDCPLHETGVRYAERSTHIV